MSQGLNFCKVDLHVHTPQSECFLDKSVTPEMIVDQALKVGMKAIAITDHNSGDAVDGIKAAAKDKGLVVFPGVEINIQPGVHVLAIFPEDKTSSNVNDLLQDLGLGTEKRGKNDSVVLKYGINEALSIIKKDGALPVLAHIDDISGAWNELRKTGQTFIQMWGQGEFVAVEIVGDQLPEGIGKDPFYRIPAYYWSSDNPHPDDPSKHSHLGIGSRYSLMKLPDPITWEGLRLCFQDPKSRIKPGKDYSISHPLLESISIEGGFLNNINIDLNPNLNCFIGGRGTGKSCLLEVIRHAFGINPKTDQNQTQAKGIIENTFPVGSKVSIHLRLSPESIYKIERISGDTPKVYRQGETVALDLKPGDLLPIQVYGQKEIYEISRDPNFQLRLFDNFLSEILYTIKKEEEHLINELQDNSHKIKILLEEIEEIRSEVSSLGSISEQLHRMEKQDFSTKLDRKSSFDQEKEYLDLVQVKTEGIKSKISTFLADNLISFDGFNQGNVSKLPNKLLLEKQRSSLDEINQSTEVSLKTLLNNINEIQNRNNEEIESWKSEYSDQEEAYQLLLREYQSNTGELKPERFIHLQSEQRRLQGLSLTLIEKEKNLHEITNQRRGLLSDLRANRKLQYEERQAKASELTTTLDKKVRITIWPQGNREEYLKRLDTLFEGTRTRNDILKQISVRKSLEPARRAQQPVSYQGGTRYVIPEIPQFIDQIDLANAIRKEKEGIPEEESDLSKVFGVNSSAMRNCMSSLSDDNLYDLEVLEIPDLPIIELQVGTGNLGYKPLGSLSVGQKCTALLSLVLLESPAPLLIDQPEDDLDNHFIFDQIVTTLRNAKEKKQFLIATHNANIPVSGDAELIMVLEADEQHGYIAENGIGSIDSPTIKSHVEHILEGGKDAFLIRKEKYGI